MTSHHVLWRHTTCYIWRHTTCYDVTPRVIYDVTPRVMTSHHVLYMTSHHVLWRHTTCYIWRHTTCYDVTPRFIYDVTPRVMTSHYWAAFITALGLNVRVVPLFWIFSPWITLLFFLAEVIVKLRVSLAAVISVAESVSIVVLDMSAIWFNFNVTHNLLKW